jgi:hypothetical protein
MARGQSETLGLVLLLGITAAGVGVVVVTAGGAMDGAQQSSSIQRAEHSMSLLDARGSLVALGRTDGQAVSLGDSSRGSYRVQPNSGRVVVAQEKNGTRTEYLNTTLGSVVYENGETSVAYQGGGVWRSSGRGASMISPPEFNYRGATLTFPVIRVAGGESSVSGMSTARLSPDEVDKPVFPTANRSNPLTGGNVTVSVYSDYYRGWETFFQQRSTGNVTVYPNESRVDLRLVGRGSGGEFTLDEMPQELRGLADGEEDPIQSLKFELEENQNGPGFNTLQWSLVAEEGPERFEMYVGQADACDPDRPVRVTYENGDTTHQWSNESAFRESNSSFTYDCSGDNPVLRFDFGGDTNLTYDGGSSPLSNNSTGHVVNHFLTEMGPNVELHTETKTGEKTPGNSAGLDVEASTGSLDYSASSANVVTFLHITENTMNVTVS